jgi:hypothetical protein
MATDTGKGHRSAPAYAAALLLLCCALPQPSAAACNPAAGIFAPWMQCTNPAIGCNFGASLTPATFGCTVGNNPTAKLVLLDQFGNKLPGVPKCPMPW